MEVLYQLSYPGMNPALWAGLMLRPDIRRPLRSGVDEGRHVDVPFVEPAGDATRGL
jgi:hypothetical protein